MIGKLTGRIDARFPDHVLIDVHGVGYVVHCSERTLAALPGVGEYAALYTELLVREDLLQLFGFLTVVEREWHRLLTSVQGVGAKGALAIQGTLGAEGLSRAIALGDWAAVKAAPGVGPKIAQRIVNELKDKAPAVMAMGAGPGGPGPEPAVAMMAATKGDSGSAAEAAAAPARPTGQGSKRAATPTPVAGAQAPDRNAGLARAAAQADALSALVNLGYGQGEAAAAVAEAAAADESEDVATDPATLIRAALRLLAPAG